MTGLDARITGGGEATDEEVAAIMAAVEVLSARPAPAPEEEREDTRWRFSGRWWVRPVPIRRARP